MGWTLAPARSRGWSSSFNACDVSGLAFAQHVRSGWHSTTAATVGSDEVAMPSQAGGSLPDQAPRTRIRPEPISNRVSPEAPS